MLKREDRVEIEGLGRTWGLSLILPASPDNVEIIKAGPPALKQASEYYQIAKDRDEQFDIVESFHKGSSPFSPSNGYYQLDLMFRQLIGATLTR